MSDSPFELRLGPIDRFFSGMSHGITVLLVVKGAVSFESGGGDRILNADDIVLLGHREMYGIGADGNNLALLLRASGGYLRREFPMLLSARFACDSAAGENQQEKQRFFPLKRALIRMMLAYYRKEEGYELEVRRALLDLLHDAYRDFRREDARGAVAAEENGLDGPIRRALQYIHENYKSEVTLVAAAECANMSPQYFSKRFKRRMGCGFLSYIANLRLESAARDLLRGGESILRIAVNNGFAGSKPFSVAFKGAYGVTPNEYRKSDSQRAKRAGNVNEEIEDFFRTADTPGFEELMKYIALYDIRHGYRTSVSEKTAVSLAQTAEGDEIRFVQPKKVFKIGRLAEALDDRVKRQIAHACRKFHGTYIHFKGVYDDGIRRSLDGSFFKGYEYGRLLSYFFEAGLTPFVDIDLSAVEDFSVLAAFVADLHERHDARWAAAVLFEVTSSSPMPDETFLDGYRAVREIVKSRSAASPVGFHSTSRSDRAEAEAFADRLRASVRMGCPPDFLTLTSDPLLERDYAAFLDGPEKRIERYGAERVESVRGIASACGLRRMPLFVVEWNTLSGRDAIESSAFFRAALLASELVSFGTGKGEVAGVAFWLNSRSKEMLTGRVESRVVALFFYEFVKRPVYHLLYFVDRLFQTVVHRDERLIVTRLGKREYAILVRNPRYFNPLYSVDEAYVSMERLNVEAQLNDLPVGKYRVKTFAFDKKHSAVFDRWTKTGYPDLNDPDVSEYLEHVVLPDFDTFETEAYGTYILDVSLSYNSVALYLIKRID